MNNYERHARDEFRAAGWTDENGKFKDEMQEMICNDVLRLLEVFHDGRHSGTSGHYEISLFKRLAMFVPIAPLTGEDWEWADVTVVMGYKCWQNRRFSQVFKDANGAYDSQGIVFWEWAKDEDGEPYKTYYTSRGSSVPVTFPYTVPDKPQYMYRHSDAEPQQPAQNEEGFL